MKTGYKSHGNISVLKTNVIKYDGIRCPVLYNIIRHKGAVGITRVWGLKEAKEKVDLMMRSW